MVVIAMSGGRVLIADDHPLTREGLAIAVRSAFPGATIDTAGTIDEAQERLRLHSGYRAILLDFILPDARGFSGLMQLQHRVPAVPIVIVSAHEDPALVEAARALGARGFLHKSQPLDILARLLSRIAAGETVFPSIDNHSAHGDLRRRLATLSQAQMRVMLQLADGQLNKQIAGALGISEATVKAHMTAILRKLGVRNRAQALLAVQPLLGTLR